MGVAKLLSLAALVALSAAASPIGSGWPEQAVVGADRTVLQSLGAQPLPVGLEAKHARMLAASDAPPSMEEIAQFNIILFISIALVLISYFSMMAMVNMDVGSDSLLYSKSKSD